MAGYGRGRDAVKVGILAIVAAIAFGLLFMRMTNRVLSLSQWDLLVHIPAADGLKKRDPVFFRGVTVGEVKTLEFTEAEGNCLALGVSRWCGDVLVRVHLNRRIPLTRSSTAELVPLDLFGRQSLVLREGAGSDEFLEDGDSIRAPRPVSMSGKVSELAERGEQLLSEETVHLLRDALGGTSAAGQGVAALTMRMDALLAAQQQALTTVLEQTTAIARNLNAATDPAQLADLRSELNGAVGGLAQLTARLDSTAATAAAVLGSLRDGQGSAGLLLSDPQLYVRISELLASADGLVKDFKANPKKYINVSVF